MKDVRRWDVQTMDERTSSEGKWVLHCDYEQVLEQVQILWAQKVVERDAEIARLRAEADALRVDAERWRFLASASSSVTFRLHNARPDHRERAIDAAMGADA
ncbi:hypothetical protein [Stenotrophomonas cyclobalanopsidis]|uniref:hypothetical protein n=1 Tax=Stenotrophomonas cyclobalanopsidis TaxID=2771362 RepID=UPI002FD937F8